jgi:hypothetical protein
MKVNNVLKQMTVLSVILVLVGMVFLVSSITEKALAIIHATATGTCGTTTATGEPLSVKCEFTLMDKKLISGIWCSYPTQSGTRVGWDTAGSSCSGAWIPKDEEGWVLYKVGGGEAKLHFNSPAVGSNNCNVEIVSGQGEHGLSGTCHAAVGHSAAFTYTLHSGKLEPSPMLG